MKLCQLEVIWFTETNSVFAHICHTYVVFCWPFNLCAIYVYSDAMFPFGYMN